MNLDLRSLKLQRELMLWTYDAEKTRELEAIFDRDLEKCKEVTLKNLSDMTAFVNFRNSASRLGANLL
jgi:cardiolipin synthase